MGYSCWGLQPYSQRSTEIFLAHRTPGIYASASPSPISLRLLWLPSQTYSLLPVLWNQRNLKKKIKLLGEKKMSICKFPTWPCLPVKTQKSPGEVKEEDFVSLFSFQMELPPTGCPHTQEAEGTGMILVVLCRPWASIPIKINNSEHI